MAASWRTLAQAGVCVSAHLHMHQCAAAPAVPLHSPSGALAHLEVGRQLRCTRKRPRAGFTRRHRSAWALSIDAGLVWTDITVLSTAAGRWPG